MALSFPLGCDLQFPCPQVGRLPQTQGTRQLSQGVCIRRACSLCRLRESRHVHDKEGFQGTKQRALADSSCCGGDDVLQAWEQVKMERGSFMSHRDILGNSRMSLLYFVEATEKLHSSRNGISSLI